MINTHSGCKGNNNPQYGTALLIFYYEQFQEHWRSEGNFMNTNND
jgi:hypothetical protein